MDNAVYFLAYYGYLLVLALAAMKAVHYRSNKKWSLCFFYFSSQNIAATPTKQRRDFKEIQNRFSIAILLIVILWLVVYLIVQQ